MCRPDEAVSVTQLLCKLKFILRRSSFVLVLRANSSNSRHSPRHHVHRHSFFLSKCLSRFGTFAISLVCKRESGNCALKWRLNYAISSFDEFFSHFWFISLFLSSTFSNNNGNSLQRAAQVKIMPGSRSFLLLRVIYCCTFIVFWLVPKWNQIRLETPDLLDRAGILVIFFVLRERSHNI